MKTGSYTFHFHEEEIVGKMLLQYEATSTQLCTSPVKTEMNKPRIEQWTSEQIGDFVRKLGFLDKDEDDNDEGDIKRFLHLDQV